MKNWLSELEKMPGAVDRTYDPFIEGVRSKSPSVNFIFGNTHLIPFGYSVILWGPSKGGKSLVCNSIIGQLHQDYEDAIAVKFNTEMREEAQSTSLQMKNFGIDLNRYMAVNTNRPEEIFNEIEGRINDLCEKGCPIKLIIIDSISDIAGRRSQNAKGVEVQQIGDEAATIQAGLKRIRAVLRRHRITLIMTAHERAELDAIEQMRGKKVRMAGANYLRHFAEYFVRVWPDETKEGKTDLLGNKFENSALKDVNDNAEKVGHKIRVKMVASSVGTPGREGEFTLHYHNGIVNIHEEVFTLGITRGIFYRPNNRSYILKNWPVAGEESKWSSYEDALRGVKDNTDIQKEIVKRIKLADIEARKNGVPEVIVATVSSLEEDIAVE
jgi:archaellum biogenesis ATPase FlaH